MTKEDRSATGNRVEKEDPFRKLDRRQRSVALILWEARRRGGKQAMAAAYLKLFPKAAEHSARVMAERAAKEEAES